jgi:hypothetical protein
MVIGRQDFPQFIFGIGQGNDVPIEITIIINGMQQLFQFKALASVVTFGG